MGRNIIAQTTKILDKTINALTLIQSVQDQITKQRNKQWVQTSSKIISSMIK